MIVTPIVLFSFQQRKHIFFRGYKEYYPKLHPTQIHLHSFSDSQWFAGKEIVVFCFFPEKIID